MYMRFVFCAILLSLSTAGFAQDDDMPDFRSKRDNLLKMQEKDLQADIATFTMAGIDISNARPPIASVPVQDFGDDFLTFDSGSIRVTIKSAPFTVGKHKMQYVDKYLVRIDMKPYFGSYSKVPKKYIQSINVVVDGDTVAIPAAAYADLYEPGLTYAGKGGESRSLAGVYYSGNKQSPYRTVYIYLLCNDGLGGYEVTWVIQDKKYLRRVVDAGILKN